MYQVWRWRRQATGFIPLSVLVCFFSVLMFMLYSKINRFDKYSTMHHRHVSVPYTTSLTPDLWMWWAYRWFVFIIDITLTVAGIQSDTPYMSNLWFNII